MSNLSKFLEFSYQKKKCYYAITDMETDESWDIFINMKNQFWALGCGLGWTVKKKFGPIMSNFLGLFF